MLPCWNDAETIKCRSLGLETAFAQPWINDSFQTYILFKWVLCTCCEKQVEILEEGMAVHGNRITAALKPLHENLEKRFKEMKSKTAPFKRVIQISFSQ